MNMCADHNVPLPSLFSVNCSLIREISGTSWANEGDMSSSQVHIPGTLYWSRNWELEICGPFCPLLLCMYVGKSTLGGDAQPGGPPLTRSGSWITHVEYVCLARLDGTM